MKEVSTISKRKSRSRPQNRRQQPRPVNKGYGDAGASWHKKATKVDAIVGLYNSTKSQNGGKK